MGVQEALGRASSPGPIEWEQPSGLDQWCAAGVWSRSSPSLKQISGMTELLGGENPVVILPHTKRVSSAEALCIEG